MLKRSASKDRQIFNFQRPFDFQFTPYKQLDFSDGVREYCSSIPVVSNLRISKAIFLGDIGVGKTSVVRRFCHEVYDSNYKATIGVDFEVERFDVLSIPFSVQIWDTAGQERFKCIASSYYRCAHAIVVVFDLSRLQTLSNCSQWLREALEENKNSPAPHIFLVGNKIDAVSPAAYEALEKIASQASFSLNAEFWAVSSKTGDNINELFLRIVSLTFDSAIVREREEKCASIEIGNISLNQKKKKKKKACKGCKDS